MRGSEVRELIQQIAVRPNLICHASVRVHRKENVGNVIGQRPAIVRKGYRAARIIGENVWQQRFRDAFGILRGVAAQCSNSCANTPMKRLSFAGSPLRYSSLFSPGRKTACKGLPPRSAWIQPSTVLSTVRAQIPTALVPKAELGSSSTMLQTSLSVKKSSPVNCM